MSERKRHFSKKPSQNKKIFFENFLEAEKPAQETHKKRGQETGSGLYFCYKIKDLPPSLFDTFFEDNFPMCVPDGTREQVLNIIERKTQRRLILVFTLKIISNVSL